MLRDCDSFYCATRHRQSRSQREHLRSALRQRIRRTFTEQEEKEVKLDGVLNHMHESAPSADDDDSRFMYVDCWWPKYCVNMKYIHIYLDLFMPGSTVAERT